jgi:flagellar biosynthesis protein FlhG
MIKRRTPTPGYDQAHRLRRLMAKGTAAEAERQTHVVSVVSGKGGVGKTFVSANLAIAMAARGHKVILFDMDMGLANTDIVLGVEPQCTWSEVLSGRRDVDEVILGAPGDIAFVPGASGLTELANLSEFERHQLMSAMAQIEREYDLVVMDCGAGISRNVIEFAASADTVLVVTTPEPTSITDAYATIKTLARDRSRSNEPDTSLQSQGLVVNLAESRREGRSTYERLASVTARFLHMPITDYGYVLRDEHVTAAVRQRVPVVLRYPRAPASTCLMASAGRLARDLGQPEAKESLFYRVINMFL